MYRHGVRELIDALVSGDTFEDSIKNMHKSGYAAYTAWNDLMSQEVAGEYDWLNNAARDAEYRIKVTWDKNANKFDYVLTKYSERADKFKPVSPKLLFATEAELFDELGSFDLDDTATENTLRIYVSELVEAILDSTVEDEVRNYI